jgi:hypothetical protein
MLPASLPLAISTGSCAGCGTERCKRSGYIGFDLSFIRLNTAFAGTANLNALGTVFQSNAIGRSSGVYNIDNQNVYSAMFRIQRNFLY